MTGNEVHKEKKSKKEKKEAKKIANGLSKINLATSEDKTPDATEALLAESSLKKEKKRKRKYAEEGGDLDEQRKHKKKKKSYPDNSPTISAEPAADIKENKKGKKRRIGAPVSQEEIQTFLTKNSITIHGDITPILSFSQLDIPSELALSLQGFKEPTPIQACTWPPLLAGRDVVGIAETGSGKTFAFGIPALASLAKTERPPRGENINILVVAPTRELAIQTHDTLVSAGKPLGITSVCLFGGVDKEGQRKMLKDKKLRIVVGTPGRLLDLENDGACSFSHVRFLVLDEADRMLDKGFENDIRKIIEKTPQGEARQTAMFSATWPDSVRRLAGSFQRDPVRVTVGQDDLTANKRVEQVIDVFEDSRQKDSKLLKLLKQVQKKSITPGSDESRTLIFVLYKNEAPHVENLLQRQGYTVCVLHGNISQDARLKALNDFKTGKVGVLIATDVAARGLDIPNVGTVINYTFPLTVEDYVHRIGRTGRGGREGRSITFFTGEKHEKALAGELMKVVRESGYEAEGLRKFPMTIKKKEHGAYGAYFKEVDSTVKGKKIIF